MIQTELLQDGALIRHYSDSGKALLQVETGIKYNDAIDVVPCPYTYEETEPEILEEVITPNEEDKSDEEKKSDGKIEKV